MSIKSESTEVIDGCLNALNTLYLLFGIRVSRDKNHASACASSCSCFDCQAVMIIVSILLLKKRHRDFSDNDFDYANSHAQNSDCCKLLLAIILLQKWRHPEAILLLNKLADKDFAVACLFLGNLEYQPITKDKHMQWLEKAHVLGAYEATIRLAILKFDRYKSKAENALAFALLKTVEDCGFAHALYKLAKWNEHPTGPQNSDEVVRLYSLAAQQGNAKANYRLGLIMSEGKYRQPKNVPRAVEYFSVAADKGNVDAQLALGSMYLDGDDVAKDNAKGRYYLELAASQGNKWAEIMLLKK